MGQRQGAVESLGVTTSAPRFPNPAFWRGRRVLLTGHTGFKGSWAALWLQRMGAHVTGLSLAPETKLNLFEFANVASGIDSHIVDIRDAAAIRAIIKRAEPEIMLHMAAQALVRRSYREPVDTFATNVMGTVNVLEAARDLPGLKACLVVTSDKVYENDGSGHAFREDERLGGHDPYSASKAAAEIVAVSYRSSFFASGQAKLATARGGNVIGGGDFSEDRIVPDIWRAHQARKPLIVRYPDATRPWQHVLDCLSGYFVYVEGLAAGQVSEATLNFGPRERASRPVRDVVTAMQRALGASETWQQAPGPLPKEMPALELSCERAERTLGWRSRLDSRQTIDWTAAWYKAFAVGDDVRAFTLGQIDTFMHAPATGAAAADGGTPSCRFCRHALRDVVLDLGQQPFSNSYVEPGQEAREKFYPLRVWVCPNCLLVQTDFDAPADEIFAADYAYFSSVSTSWVGHARRYAQDMIARFDLGPKSLVVEVASNDGYLLQHFVARDIPVLGIEPTRGTAEAAIAKGIKTRVAFFGEKLGRELMAETGGADLIAANNVLAHVPVIVDFTRGFAALLKPEGVVTFEFPHVQRLIEGLQFDTIYHEHYSYLSFLTVEEILSSAGLRVIDVEELPTHGGSLRVFAVRRDAERDRIPGARVRQMFVQERQADLDGRAPYTTLARRVGEIREQFLAFLAKAKSEGKTVAAYGAAAKGNTFLNYCGATARDLAFVADANTAKQGKLLPGSHVPIVSPADLLARRPDFVVILPWNLKDEIANAMAGIREWGGKFVTAVPELRIF